MSTALQTYIPKEKHQEFLRAIQSIFPGIQTIRPPQYGSYLTTWPHHKVCPKGRKVPIKVSWRSEEWQAGPLVENAVKYGEGNGTALQSFCLENPMDGGAWWAAVHGVAKSRTRLSDFTFTFHFHALEKEMATHSSVLAWRIPGMEAWWAAIHGVAQSQI